MSVWNAVKPKSAHLELAPWKFFAYKWNTRCAPRSLIHQQVDSSAQLHTRDTTEQTFVCFGSAAQNE
eukprot:6230553-Amphidinium_carterae.1